MAYKEPHVSMARTISPAFEDDGTGTVGSLYNPRLVEVKGIAGKYCRESELLDYFQKQECGGQIMKLHVCPTSAEALILFHNDKDARSVVRKGRFRERDADEDVLMEAGEPSWNSWDDDRRTTFLAGLAGHADDTMEENLESLIASCDYATGYRPKVSHLTADAQKGEAVIEFADFIDALHVLKALEGTKKDELFALTGDNTQIYFCSSFDPPEASQDPSHSSQTSDDTAGLVEETQGLSLSDTEQPSQSQATGAPSLAIKCHCDCGNSTSFQGYYSENEMLGFYCTKCWQEWLNFSLKLIPRNSEILSVMELRGIRYVAIAKSKDNLDPVFSAPPTRTAVDPEWLAKGLKRGDQIMWDIPWKPWVHHAIVEDVMIKGDACEVHTIEWNKEDSRFYIQRRVLASPADHKNINVIQYSAAVEELNPVELVLARARSLLGTAGYNFFTRNCECFATFCRTGINTTQQFEWFKKTMKQIPWGPAGRQTVTRAAGYVGEFGAAECLEAVCRDNCQSIGAGALVVIEGCYCIYDCTKMYKEYKKRKGTEEHYDRNTFIGDIVGRVSEFVFGGGLGAAASWGVEMFATTTLGLGAALGGFVLPVVAGVVGAVLGRALAKPVGRLIAPLAIKCFGSEHRKVALADIQPADHLVVRHNDEHPECHVIVTAVDRDKGTLVVVRHSHTQEGLVQQELRYVPDHTHKYSYRKDVLLCSREEILTNAVLALSCRNRGYKLLSSDCQRFAFSVTIKHEGCPKP